MKTFLKNYRSTLILLLSIVIGVILGMTLKNNVTFLKPFGDLFLNLLLVTIVPLIFLTITTSIAKMKNPKRIGKIMITILLVFLVTSIVACLISFIVTMKINLVNPSDSSAIQKVFEATETISDDTTILDKTMSLLSVSDFPLLLSKSNIIALLVASIIVGIAINMAGKNGEDALKVLISFNEVIQNVVKIIMYYAPIGIACYIAYLIGTLGNDIAAGFLKTFIIYIVISIIFYIIMYTIYAFIAGGKKGIKLFWKNQLPSCLTALATCSSAASIPVNVTQAKKMGVPNDIAETTIPMGTSFHKDGSIIGSVFKIMFLVSLFGTNINSFSSIVHVLLVALLANLLITGVPIGGGTISEMLILSMMGYPIEALPILTIIATIIDPPATALNVVGDTTSSMLVARVVDGKDWLKKVKE